MIKDAGGEQTISVEGGSLFPDVLLFGDRSTARILQGWELKMPDTRIDDQNFFGNAVSKAEALGLDSFVLWNVTHARLYTRNADSGQFVCLKQWPPLAHIADRTSVQRNRADWERLADAIISDLNVLFEDGSLEGRPFVDAYRTGGIQSLILANTENVAAALEEAALRDPSLRAEITFWWQRYKEEYQYARQDWFQALAHANLSNWIGKLLFAHILQGQDDRASVVTQLDETTSPSDALGVFRSLSEGCNFRTVFSDSVGLSLVPRATWVQLLQFNGLLADLRIGSIDQQQLAVILEASAETAVRKVRGQYATPPALARLMAALALRNIIDDRLLDPCCGSGTIARAALEQKLEDGVQPRQAAATVFASDLDPQAVQLAALAMVRPSLMHIPLRLFRKDAFRLQPDAEITFHHPSDGSSFTERLGSFDAIASNLPFVSQVGRQHYTEGIDAVNTLLGSEPVRMSGRSDIAAYLPFALHCLLATGGRLVIIISNAWLGTEWGEAFWTLILQFYRIKSIVTSGSGRWFQNSEVVTNLLVMEKREAAEDSDEAIDFIILKRPLQEFADSQEAVAVTWAQIEEGRALADTMRIRSVSRGEVDLLAAKGLGRSAHFGDCDWTRELPLVPLRNLCVIGRGKRRGCDRMFYPTANHGIEPEYIRTVLKSPAEISRYSATAEKEAFCCSVPVEQLEQRGHTGALRWIRHFEQETNGKGRPLPEALAKSGMYWYEMRSDSMAELVMPINPGDRLYVALLDPPAFVNQRLTRLNSRLGVDIDLLFALLNSAISLFYMEGLGFGRGLGALDLSTTRVRNAMHVLDPQRLDGESAFAVKSAFRPLLSREICPVVDECELVDRQQFDSAVIEAFGLSVSRDRVYDSLKELIAIRLAATEVQADGG